MISITAIILTYNEEQHIARCIQSLAGVASEVFVVDSFSTDKTVEIATALGAKVYQNAWVNYASQFNWALETCNINTDWVWRIDADEYADAQLVEQLIIQIPAVPKEVTGIYVRRGIVFMGKLLRHGTWAPRPTLKIFRTGVGTCENRWMDEHIILSQGETLLIKGNQIDDNLNDLSWWTNKHNHYATREMVDMFCIKYGLGTQQTVESKLFGSSEQRKRWLKLRYAGIPLFIRPFLNFVYRYIFRLGFLDGKAGFMWHVLQGFWYRFLVDSKIYEMQRRFKHDPKAIAAFLKKTYHLD